MNVIRVLPFIVYECLHSVLGMQLIEPLPGICGDKTRLVCVTQNSTDIGLQERKWYKNGIPILRNGMESMHNGKYRETIDKNKVYLTIGDTDRDDEALYRCSVGFKISNSTYLLVECKAVSKLVNVTVTRSKQLNIILDRLYPDKLHIGVTLLPVQGPSILINGSPFCVPSEKFRNYFRCVWNSQHPLLDGSYNCSVVVTTITKAEPIIRQLFVGDSNTIRNWHNHIIDRNKEQTMLPIIKNVANCTQESNKTRLNVEKTTAFYDTGLLSQRSVDNSSNGYLIRCHTDNQSVLVFGDANSKTLYYSTIGKKDYTSVGFTYGFVAMAVVLCLTVVLFVAVYRKRRVTASMMPSLPKNTIAERSPENESHQYQWNSFQVISDMENDYDEIPNHYGQFACKTQSLEIHNALDIDNLGRAKLQNNYDESINNEHYMDILNRYERVTITDTGDNKNI